MNAADLPSRGANPSELTESTCWFTIPHHVCEPEQLDCGSALEVVPDECLIELKAESRPQSIQNLLTNAPCRLDVAIRCEDFSTLKPLLKVTALVSRFAVLLRSRVKT